MDGNSGEEEAYLLQRSEEKRTDCIVEAENENCGESRKPSKLRELLTILLVLLLLFLGTAVDTMPIPFLPTAMKKRGLGETQTGLILAAYDLSRILLSPLCGHLVIKLNPKNSLLLAGLISGTTCILVGLIVYTQGQTLFVLSVAARIFGGLGASLMTIAVSSLVLKAEHFSVPTVGGWLEMSIGLGYLGGTMFGGILYKLVGYTFSFLVFGVLVVILTIPVYVATPFTTEVIEEETRGFTKMLMIPGVFMMALGMTITEMSMVGTFAMMSTWMIEVFEVNLWTVSMIYSGAPLAYILFIPVATLMANHGLIYSQVIAGFASASAVLFLMVPSPIFSGMFPVKWPLWLTAALCITYAFTQAMVYIPSLQAGLYSASLNGCDSSSIQTLTMLSAVSSAGMAFGSMFGAPISGAITEHASFPWSTTTFAFTCGTMALLYISYVCLMRCKGIPLRPPDYTVT